ncbi:MAG TPA: hypothetical protein VED40_13210 [Azospirillaceae bacterium]|nr:hypothetical protein [Azospirillaceae bacterium]
MTLALSATDTRSAAPARGLRSFHLYAVLSALVALDLLLFADWIAALAFTDPALTSSVDSALWLRGLGIGTLLFALTVEISARRGGRWLEVAPLMAGTAGAVCFIAIAAAWSVLSPLAVAVLAVLGAIDLAFARSMRRAVEG